MFVFLTFLVFTIFLELFSRYCYYTLYQVGDIFSTITLFGGVIGTLYYTNHAYNKGFVILSTQYKVNLGWLLVVITSFGEVFCLWLKVFKGGVQHVLLR